MSVLRTDEQRRIYRRLLRGTVDDLGLQSARELTPAQQQVVVDLAVERAAERSRARRNRKARGFDSARDLSWDGPLARWLAMTGKRPIRESIDIGDYNDRRRGRRLSWEDV